MKDKLYRIALLLLCAAQLLGANYASPSALDVAVIVTAALALVGLVALFALEAKKGK